jgi:hypothetical protein
VNGLDDAIRPIRKCGWCGHSIEGRRATAAYCSTRCRVAAHRADKAAKDGSKRYTDPPGSQTHPPPVTKGASRWLWTDLVADLFDPPAQWSDWGFADDPDRERP